MINLDNKLKFQRDILNSSVTIYPLVVIDNEINISTVNEVILNNEEEKTPVDFKDYALKLSSIKESINVKDHRFKISNVTLTLNNYLINKERLSDSLINKVNKKVEVYFKTQSCNYLSDCLLVYRGVIKRFNHDDTKVSLNLEDLTDKLVHKDLPSATIKYKENALNKKFIGKHIPMSYGYVRKAPLIPYLINNPTSAESFLYMIPDDVDQITDSSRGISIEGFSTDPLDSDSLDFLKESTEIEQASNPLFLYKENYFRVLKNYHPQFDRLAENDLGYNEELQYTVDPTDNFILMDRIYLGEYAQNSTAIGELQTIKVWNPDYTTILSQEGESTIEGAGNSSVVNIVPNEGILRPEAAVDHIESGGIFNTSEFQSFAQIPNSQPTVENTLEQFSELLPNGGYEINLFKPWNVYQSVGMLFPTEGREDNHSYWKIVSSWLLANSHHFQGKVRIMQHPTSEMIRREVKDQIIKMLIEAEPIRDYITNADDKTNFIVDSTQIAFQYNLKNAHYIDSEGFYNVTPHIDYWDYTEREAKWKDAWKNGCSLDGTERSFLEGTGAAIGDTSYYNRNYQWITRPLQWNVIEETYIVFGEERTRNVYEYTQGFAADNLSRVFDGSMGNGGEGAPCYMPSLIHKFSCNEARGGSNPVINSLGIRAIYVGQWNNQTMSEDLIGDDELWFDVFNQNNGKKYLFEKSDFASFFPLEQKFKNWGTSYKYDLEVNFSALWNGINQNKYIKKPVINLEVVEGQGRYYINDTEQGEIGFESNIPVSNPYEMFHTHSKFDTVYGYWNEPWHMGGYRSTTKQSDIFSRYYDLDVRNEGWAIYIEDDIAAGEVLRKMSEAEYKGEYYNNNTKTHLSKGTVLPLFSQLPRNLHPSQPSDSWFFEINQGFETVDNNIKITEGTVDAAAERLAVTFPLSNITSKDVIKTKTYAYGKFNVNIPVEEGDIHNVSSTDNFLIDAIATDVLSDQEQDFLSLVDPAFGVNLLNIEGSNSLFTDGGDIDWDCRPNADVPNNTFESLDDDVDNENTNSLISYELSDWDTPDAFNGISLVYRLWSENNPDQDKRMQFNTKINTFGLLQFNIFEKVFEDKFYADIRGRANNVDDIYYNAETGISEPKYIHEQEEITTKIMIENPCDIMYHIVEKELDQIDIVDRDSWKINRGLTRNINLAFSVIEKINSKKLLQEISQNSTVFPRFESSGGFSFKTIQNTYSRPDATINTDELIKLEFSRTPIENVHTIVNVKYNKDYATDTFSSQTGYCDGYDFFGNGENNSDVIMSMFGGAANGYPVLKKGYDYSSLGLKREEKVLEFESNYIRDEASAMALRDYIYLLNCNQHTIIKCTLNIKNGIALEVGDVVAFDKLFNGLKAYGEDYTIENERNGQKIYPFFIITSCSKTNKDVKIQCMQLHKLEATFQAGLGSVSRKSQVGLSDYIWRYETSLLPIEEYYEGGIINVETGELWESVGAYWAHTNQFFNINNNFTLEDLGIMENIISNNLSYVTQRQMLSCDIVNDSSVDEYDLYVASTLLGWALIPEDSGFQYEGEEDIDGEQPLPEAILGDINNDGIVNVVDVLNVLAYCMGTDVQINLNVADFNEDGQINIVDVVNMVNQILEN